MDWSEIGWIAWNGRIERHWTQTQLAAAAGTSQRLVSKLEKGHCQRPSAQVVQILRVLGLEHLAYTAHERRRPEKTRSFMWLDYFAYTLHAPDLEFFELQDLRVYEEPSVPMPAGKSYVSIRIGGLGIANLGRTKGKRSIGVEFDGGAAVEITVHE